MQKGCVGCLDIITRYCMFIFYLLCLYCDILFRIVSFCVEFYTVLCNL